MGHSVGAFTSRYPCLSLHFALEAKRLAFSFLLFYSLVRGQFRGLDSSRHGDGVQCQVPYASRRCVDCRDLFLPEVVGDTRLCQEMLYALKARFPLTGLAPASCKSLSFRAEFGFHGVIVQNTRRLLKHRLGETQVVTVCVRTGVCVFVCV